MNKIIKLKKPFKKLICVLLSLVLLISIFQAKYSNKANAEDFSDHLTHYWKFDEGQGTVAYSTKGLNNDALLNLVDWSGGKVVNALRFSSLTHKDDYATADNVNISGNEMTVSFWLRYSPTDAFLTSNSRVYETILSKRYNNTDYLKVEAYKQNNGKINIMYTLTTQGHSGRTHTITSTDIQALKNNEWVHIACTYDGEFMNIYANGERVKNYGGASGAILDINNTYNDELYIGKAYDSSWDSFSGTLDELKFYDKALTPNEIVSEKDLIEYPSFSVGIIEAEAMYLKDSYTRENNNMIGNVSNETIKISSKNAEGQAIFKFSGPSDTYSIKIAYIKENDGKPNYGFYINNTNIESWTSDKSSASFESDIYEIDNVDLATGDIIKLYGKANSGAYARIDYIEIKKVIVPVTNWDADKVIRVLEVQPNRSFELNEEAIADAGFTNNVSITQMNMSEFVSKIEDINGNYDLVYMGNKKVDGKGYYKLGSYPSKSPLGNNNGITTAEYYSGNDITDRRSRRIYDYIASGQLIVFDKTIFTDTSIKDTKLYNNFSKYSSGYSNVMVKTSSTQFSDLFANYFESSIIKRPYLKLTETPLPYDSANPSSYQEEKKLKYLFNIKNLNGLERKMKINVYGDLNGNGLYSESNELLKTIDNLSSGDDKSINIPIDSGFSGLLPWRLELIDASGAKTQVTGYTAFKGDEIPVRVLHLMPDNNSLSLKSSGMKDLLYKSGEYKINVTEMKVDDFSNSYNTDKPVVLNGNYDMIILGFADTYGGKDIKNNLAINAIKEFINTGQSVLFTHDTMTFRMLDTNGWAYNLTKEFRDFVGQNIYKYDPLKYSSEVAARDASEYYDYRLDFPNTNKPSLGFSTTALNRAQNGSFSTSNMAYKINDGYMTNYPYDVELINIATTHYQYYQLDLEDETLVPWYTLYNNYDEFDGRNNYYTYSKGGVTYSGTGHSSPNVTTNDMERRFFVNTMIKSVMGAQHAPTLEVFGLNNGDEVLTSEQTIDFSIVVSDIDKKDKYFNVNIYVDKNGDGEYSIEDGEKELAYLIDGVDKVENSIEKVIQLPKNVAKDIENFGVKIDVFDANGAYTTKTINLIHKADSVLDLDFDSNSAGYLIGDKVELEYIIKAITEKIELKKKYENVYFYSYLDKNNFEVSIDDPNMWTKSLGDYTFEGNTFKDIDYYKSSVQSIVFNKDATTTWGTKTKEVKPLEITFKNEGDFKIYNKLTFDKSYYNDTELIWNADNDVKSKEKTFLLSVKEGKVNVEVKDVFDRGIPNVQVKVYTLPKDVAVDENYDLTGITPIFTGITGNTGALTASKLPSGKYIVETIKPDGFNSNKTKELISLDYTNSSRDISFVMSADAIANIDFGDRNADDGTDAVVLRKLLGTNWLPADLEQETYITFDVFKSLDTLSITLDTDLDNLSYLGNISLYSLSGSNYEVETYIGNFTIDPNNQNKFILDTITNQSISALKAGKYKVVIKDNFKNILSDTDLKEIGQNDAAYIMINEISYKETSFDAPATIAPTNQDFAGLFDNYSLTVAYEKVYSPVKNVLFRFSDGTLSKLFNEGTSNYSVTMSFDLTRPINSLSYALSENSPQISSLDYSRINWIKYTGEDGVTTFLSNVALSDLTKGKYEINFNVSANTTPIDKSVFKISLDRIVTNEPEVGEFIYSASHLVEARIDKALYESSIHIKNMSITGRSSSDTQKDYTNVVDIKRVQVGGNTVISPYLVNVKVDFMTTDITSNKIAIKLEPTTGSFYGQILRDENHKIKLYKDGVLVDSSKYTTTINNWTLSFDSVSGGVFGEGSYSVVLDVNITDVAKSYTIDNNTNELYNPARILLSSITITPINEPTSIVSKYEGDDLEFMVTERKSKIVPSGITDRFNKNNVAILKAGNVGNSYIKLNLDISEPVESLKLYVDAILQGNIANNVQTNIKRIITVYKINGSEKVLYDNKNNTTYAREISDTGEMNIISLTNLTNKFTTGKYEVLVELSLSGTELQVNQQYDIMILTIQVEDEVYPIDLNQIDDSEDSNYYIVGKIVNMPDLQ